MKTDRNAGSRQQQEQWPRGLHCYDSRELFHGAREVIIEHAGQAYRLRITRQDKLILTK